MNSYTAASTVWNGPVCRSAERLTSTAYRVPLAGGACALLLILAFRPYRPRLRPFFTSRMPQLASGFLHPIKEVTELAAHGPKQEPRTSVRDPENDLRARPRSISWWDDPWKNSLLYPVHPRALASLAAALTYVLLYPIDKLLGLPSWAGAVMTRFAILAGARAAAASAPGMDVLPTAFRPGRTGRRQEGVIAVRIPKTIQCDIEQRLNATSHVNFAALRSILGPAPRVSLLDAVNSVFTNIHLLHAQYYQDDRIIDAIAQCIVGRRPPEWQSDGAETTQPP
jgi:hypothetical protein